MSPRRHEIPTSRSSISVADRRRPYTRLGAKGIAEGNQYSTPVCVANAVADALGREDVTLPLVPAKVFEWINGAEAPPPAAAARGAAGPNGLTGEGEIVIAAPPELVWSTLLDPEKMAKAIPGCEGLSVAGPNVYRGSLRIGVGPVRGLFDAHVRLSEIDKPRSVVLSGQLLGPLGSSQGRGRVGSKPVGEGTRLRYDYEMDLAGKVAMVGGRMLYGAARMLIDQFLKGLLGEIEGPPKRRKRSAPRCGRACGASREATREAGPLRLPAPRRARGGAGGSRRHPGWRSRHRRRTVADGHPATCGWFAAEPLVDISRIES